jgi:hypothetical protein
MRRHRAFAPIADALIRPPRQHPLHSARPFGPARLRRGAAALRRDVSLRQALARRLLRNRERARRPRRACVRRTPQPRAQAPQGQAPSHRASRGQARHEVPARRSDERRAGAGIGDLRRRQQPDTRRRRLLCVRWRRRTGMRERIGPDRRAAPRPAALSGGQQRRRMERSELPGRQHADADRRRWLRLRRRLDAGMRRRLEAGRARRRLAAGVSRNRLEGLLRRRRARTVGRSRKRCRRHS